MEKDNLIIYKNKDVEVIVDAIIAVGYCVNSRKATKENIGSTN